MIKNVIFDIGNVLVDFRWRSLMEELQLPIETQKRFEKTVFGSPWWGELDHGIYEEAEILAHFREDNKDHLDAFNLVWDNRDKLVAPYAYAVQWIEQLKKSGFKVYLLSNYPRDVFVTSYRMRLLSISGTCRWKGGLWFCEDGQTKCRHL